MDKVALSVRLQAKEGKESEVEKFLRDALSTVQTEQGTTVWYALRVNRSTFLIFDTFKDEQGRQAHLSGEIAKALAERSAELFSQPPVIEKLDVVAEKLPEVVQY